MRILNTSPRMQEADRYQENRFSGRSLRDFTPKGKDPAPAGYAWILECDKHGMDVRFRCKKLNSDGSYSGWNVMTLPDGTHRYESRSEEYIPEGTKV